MNRDRPPPPAGVACVNGPEHPNQWSIATAETEMLIYFVQQEGEADLTRAQQEELLDCMVSALWQREADAAASRHGETG